MTVIINMPVAVFLTADPQPNMFNFATLAGDSRKLTITVYDSTRTVVDLTGCTIAFSISNSPNMAAFVTYSIGSGITVSSPTSGVFVVVLSASDMTNNTISPPFRPWYYQCRITDASGNVTTALVGSIGITRQVA